MFDDEFDIDALSVSSATPEIRKLRADWDALVARFKSAIATLPEDKVEKVADQKEWIRVWETLLVRPLFYPDSARR